ncbi:hypothetical protein Tco_1154928 [Tanacetum coccineum]
MDENAPASGLMQFVQNEKPRKPKRKDTQIPQSSGPTEHVVDEAVYKELDNSLVMAVTTTSSLEVKQDSGNIIKTRSKAIPNEAGSQGTTSDGGPRRQETMGDTIAQARFENVSKLSNDLLLIRESFGDKESLGEDASKQGRINAIDADEDIILVNDQDDADMFDVNTLTGDEVLAKPKVVVKDVNLIIHEVTLAQALASLKSVKPKVKANVVEEPSVPVSVSSIKAKVQDKGRGIMVEEPVKSMKKKDLIRLDEEIASKLQARFDEEERLTREKDEANVPLTKEWDDIQAKFEVEQRRKHFAAKRAEEKRNRPPTRAQQRNIIKKVDDVQETAKVDNDQEAAKIKELMEIVPDKEEVAIDVIPLAVKPPSIVDWKIHKEGKKTYYQIIRADGSSKM